MQGCRREVEYCFQRITCPIFTIPKIKASGRLFSTFKVESSDKGVYLHNFFGPNGASATRSKGCGLVTGLRHPHNMRRFNLLQELVPRPPATLFHYPPHVGLLKRRPLPVARGQSAQPLEDVRHADVPVRHERVRHDKVPRRVRGQHLRGADGRAGRRRRRADAVRVGGRAGVGIVGASDGAGGAGGAEDVVLDLRALQGELESLVVGLQGVGGGLELGELGRQFLDVALLALAESPLTVPKGSSTSATTTMLHAGEHND